MKKKYLSQAEKLSKELCMKFEEAQELFSEETLNSMKLFSINGEGKHNCTHNWCTNSFCDNNFCTNKICTNPIGCSNTFCTDGITTMPPTPTPGTVE